MAAACGESRNARDDAVLEVAERPTKLSRDDAVHDGGRRRAVLARDSDNHGRVVAEHQSGEGEERQHAQQAQPKQDEEGEQPGLA